MTLHLKRSISSRAHCLRTSERCYVPKELLFRNVASLPGTGFTTVPLKNPLVHLLLGPLFNKEAQCHVFVIQCDWVISKRFECTLSDHHNIVLQLYYDFRMWYDHKQFKITGFCPYFFAGNWNIESTSWANRHMVHNVPEDEMLCQKSSYDLKHLAQASHL